MPSPTAELLALSAERRREEAEFDAADARRSRREAFWVGVAFGAGVCLVLLFLLA